MAPLIAGLLGAALAAPQLTVLAPRGDPEAGEEVPVWVAISEEGRALAGRSPSVEVDVGALYADGETSPGLWQFRYRAPETPQPFSITAELEGVSARASLRVLPAASDTLNAPALVQGSTGQPVSLTVRGRRDLAPEDLIVSSAEGRASAVSRDREGLRITWTPGEDPFPRAVPLGVRDQTRREEPPEWVVIQLRGHARVPVQTEPGSAVTLKVSGRSYGPVIAGPDGVANASIDVRPGEETAEVYVKDQAGNTTRSTLALGGAPTPSLALLSEPTLTQGDPAPIYVKALDPEGRPWKGAAPRCTSSVGAPRLEAGATGEWSLRLPALPDAAFFDVRVECSVDEKARANVVLPVERAQPSRIVLRTWPDELSADSPVAAVLVTLENRLGERVPGDRLELSAERGHLSVEAGMEAGALRASYDGAGALSAGEDLLRASWRLPPGSGPVVDIRLSAPQVPAGGGAVRVAGRALDARGLPLAEVDLTLSAGGTTVIVRTGADGWGRANLDVPGDRATVLEAHAGDLSRAAVMFTDRALGRSSELPDLFAERIVSIREGRVREVFISADPPAISVSDAALARITVRLLDRGGNPISQITPHLVASQGALSAPEVQADGSFVATYTPPPGLLFGDVQISATGAEGTPGEFRGSTTLSLLPRRVERAPGLNAGLLVGGAGQPTAWLDLEFDQRLPWTDLPLFARLSVATYGLSATGEDDITGASLDMALRLFPVSLGVVARAEGRRRATWIGMAALAAPYQLEVRLNTDTLVQGPGLTPPGVAGIAGASLRVRTGEVQLQAQYLGLTMGDSDVGWRGGVGGLVATVGYKLIY